MDVFQCCPVVVANLYCGDFAFFHLHVRTQQHFVSGHDSITDHRITIYYEKEIAGPMPQQIALVDHGVALAQGFPHWPSGHRPEHRQTADRQSRFSTSRQNDGASLPALPAARDINETISFHDSQRWHHARDSRQTE